jgi:hypothetical protein
VILARGHEWALALAWSVRKFESEILGTRRDTAWKKYKDPETGKVICPIDNRGKYLRAMTNNRLAESVK